MSVLLEGHMVLRGVAELMETTGIWEPSHT